jgi:acyl carrier protein
LQFAALGFDVSFQEMFSTWSEGGTLVLAGEGERRNLPGLPSLLRENKVERFYAPYVVLRQMAEACAARDEFPVGLREVITAGEQLVITRAIVRLFEELEGCAFRNHYGPSESHVVSAQSLEGEPGDWPRLPSIGRPISNARVHILNAGMRPAPIGVCGEIYLGGVALARGYLDRPELTAERFVPDPFGELFGKPGARLYQTGDLGRYLPGGSVEFLGRADSQVKIRGFRVEPGEVEAVLGRHPAVREVAVVAREATPGDRRLVAYVVPVEPGESGALRATAAEELAAELRSFLAGQLPDYMIPAAWVSLPALPLTPSGKLDRRALPDHAGVRPGLGAAYAPPRTGNEKLVAGLWREALGIERVGLEDNFFDLGGHSLLVMRVVARLSAALDRDIPVVEMFRHTTVRALAAYLSGNGERAGAPGRGGARGDERKGRPAEAGRERAERRRRLRQVSETAPRSGRGASGFEKDTED